MQTPQPPKYTLSTATCLQAQRLGREDKDASQSSQDELQSKKSRGSERYSAWEATLRDFGMTWTWVEFLALVYVPQCAPA